MEISERCVVMRYASASEIPGDAVGLLTRLEARCRWRVVCAPECELLTPRRPWRRLTPHAAPPQSLARIRVGCNCPQREAFYAFLIFQRDHAK